VTSVTDGGVRKAVRQLVFRVPRMRGRHLLKECVQRRARAKKTLPNSSPAPTICWRKTLAVSSKRECMRSGALGRWCAGKNLEESSWHRNQSLQAEARGPRPQRKARARASLLSVVDQLISSAKEKPRHRRRGSFGGNASDVFCASLMPCRAPGRCQPGPTRHCPANLPFLRAFPPLWIVATSRYNREV
jgi:hypothetical protein